jgi:PERQ amino acid-rich with GYF domain-containing protein
MTYTHEDAAGVDQFQGMGPQGPNFGPPFGSPAQGYSPMMQPSPFNARRTGSMNLGGDQLEADLNMTSSHRGFHGTPSGEPTTPATQFGTAPFIQENLGQGINQQEPMLSPFRPNPVQASSLDSPQLSSRSANQPSPAVPSPAVNPWGNPEPIGARRAPFEAPHPKVSNVIVDDRPVVPAAEPRVPQPKASTTEDTVVPPSRRQTGAAPAAKPAQNSWVNATNGIVQEGWGEPQVNSLTFDNLAQHNQQLEKQAVSSPVPPPAPAAVPPPAPEPTPAVIPTAESPVVVPAAPVPTAEPAPATPASRHKSPTVVPPKPAVEDILSSPVPEPSPVSQAPSKTPWTAVAQKDEKKATGGVMSLREIQEAEAKQAQARKVAEKERLVRASASTPADEAVTPTSMPKTTTTWGLPTSQTGPRGAVPSAKDAAAAAAATPAVNTPGGTPVWTNAAKPPAAAKKTMKEIQEEEEKRKTAAAKEKEAAAASARRYADTTKV